MGKFEKGNAGKPKGAKNKVTTDLREWITTFIDGQKEQLRTDWEMLDPKDRIMMFEKLLKYSLPTLQATSLTTDFEKMDDETLDRIIEKLKNSSNEEPDEDTED